VNLPKYTIGEYVYVIGRDSLDGVAPVIHRLRPYHIKVTPDQGYLYSADQLEWYREDCVYDSIEAAIKALEDKK
jgi:hypothetical protein